MKLSQFLKEARTVAGEAAAKRGLSHAGHGYYADRQGNIVAKSEGGERLVAVSKQEADQAQAQAASVAQAEAQGQAQIQIEQAKTQAAQVAAESSIQISTAENELDIKKLQFEASSCTRIDCRTFSTSWFISCEKMAIFISIIFYKLTKNYSVNLY